MVYGGAADFADGLAGVTVRQRKNMHGPVTAAPGVAKTPESPRLAEWKKLRCMR
jgi:hypothetical protein